MEIITEIYHKTVTRLSFLDRLKVLFGSPIIVHSTIECNNHVEITNSDSRAHVPSLYNDYEDKTYRGTHVRCSY